jgi:hypothetical protein
MLYTNIAYGLEISETQIIFFFLPVRKEKEKKHGCCSALVDPPHFRGVGDRITVTL